MENAACESGVKESGIGRVGVEIDNAINEMFNEIDLLAESENSLFNCIKPVLEDERPQPETETVEEKKSMERMASCDLDERLMEVRRKIQLMSERLRERRDYVDRAVCRIQL